MNRRTMIRRTLTIWTVATVAVVVPARARASGEISAERDGTAENGTTENDGGAGNGDIAARDDRPAVPSRALPITLIAIGAPSIVFGVIGMAFDEDPSPKLGPTIWDTGPAGAVALTTGAAFTIAGTYLYVKHADGRTRARREWMKWSGLAALGSSAIATGLGIKFGLDRRQADRDLYECSCSGEMHSTILDERARADRRAVVALTTGGVVAVAGVALLFASREGTTAPRIEVSATSASVGWATSF